MKNYTVDNLLFLRKSFPKIYHFVRNRERDSAKYHIELSRSGLPVVVVDGSIAVHSKYNPVHEAQKWIQQTFDQIENTNNLFVVGFGLGYHIEHILNEYPKMKLYIYEPELEVFLAAMEARDLKPILQHPNIVMFGTGHDKNIFRQFYYNAMEHVTDSLPTVYLPSYKRLMPEAMKMVHEGIRRVVLEYRSNFQTLFYFQEEWTENILLNLPYTLSCPPIHELKNKFGDIPVIITGSGPSLEQDLNMLKKLKKHALIIAAGSSTQALLKNGITPHLIISMDGSEPNYRAFKNLNLKGVPLLFSPIIKYKILDEVETDLYHLFFTIDTISEYLMELKKDEIRFVTTSSVTGTVIQFALFIGSKKIILMGQDLSYPNKKFYTPGVEHIDKEQIEGKINQAVLEVENVSGGKNPTTLAMLNTLRDIEFLLELYQNRGIEFINTSKQGALIKGTTFKTIEEVYTTINDIHLEDDWFKNELNRYLRPYSEQRKQRIINKAKKAVSKLKELKEQAEQLLKFIDQLNEMKHQQKSLSQLLNKIGKDWDKIYKSIEFEKIYRFVLQGHISVYVRVLPQIQNEPNLYTRADLIYKHLGGLIQQMIYISPRLIETFEKALEKITAKGEEGPNILKNDFT